MEKGIVEPLHPSKENHPSWHEQTAKQNMYGGNGQAFVQGKLIEQPKIFFWNDPKKRGLIIQVLLFIAVAFFGYTLFDNASTSLKAQKIASGFGFWDNVAGFDISQSLIFYETTSTYGRAFWVGLLNTLLVAVLGIIAATILGFTIGIARLSKNWLVRQIASGYIGLVRNVPLLLQLLLWYNVVLKALPEVRDSRVFFGSIFLNNRGFFLPQPIYGENFNLVVVSLFVGVFALLVIRFWGKKRQELTGQPLPLLWIGLGLVVGLPMLLFLILGSPLGFAYPDLGRFNIRGGVQVFPEFVALLVGLTVYAAAFIAEVVRAGILSVSKGQSEAAYALGLRASMTLRFIVIPQAMRVIIPPLTSQYLNLTKNSSLAVAIGYPELVQVFMGTVLNQTNQAVEVVFITMLVYLTISLGTSLLMNWYNNRRALVER